MTSTIELDLQTATNDIYYPTESQVKLWAEGALNKALDKLDKETLNFDLDEPIDITIRIVDEPEIQQLNKDYRDKDQPTNILSFPFEQPEHVQVNLLGDLVICSPVISKEAKEQEKSSKHHWAHMIVHGVLHLLGFDHIEDADAEEMEALEIEILNEFQVSNPYE